MSDIPIRLQIDFEPFVNFSDFIVLNSFYM